LLHRARVTIAARLLGWYDRHARVLPWRAPPGTPPPDPYRVWLSEVMLQQTTVAAVRPHFLRFTTRWPDVAALAAAEDAEVMTAWAGLGYYARARNMLACARAVVAAHGGRFPDSEAALLTLPGIGRYTAAAIAAIAFDRRAVVLDGNVERVVARLFDVHTPLPAAKAELYGLADHITPDRRPGDFAQAMMDLGATICTPRNPLCALCPLDRDCAARAAGDPARLPIKAPKAARPRRYGTIFWIEREGEVLLVRRPGKGLLGGMRALPTGPWTDASLGLDGAPAALAWDWLEGRVEHVFTHFALELRVARAIPENGCTPQLEGEWWPIARLETAGLPTVFAKAAAHAIAGDEND
jgi:A/G-specific adenine glycosylase